MSSALSCSCHRSALNIYEKSDMTSAAAIHLKSQSRLTISIISLKSIPVNSNQHNPMLITRGTAYLSRLLMVCRRFGCLDLSFTSLQTYLTLSATNLAKNSEINNDRHASPSGRVLHILPLMDVIANVCWIYNQSLAVNP